MNMMKPFVTKDITKHTTEPYSDIRAALFQKFSPKDKRGKMTKKQPVQLIDKTTATELGIQENDLWIAAIALYHKMVLVTDDRMNRIREVAPELRCYLWRSGTWA